MIQLNKLTKYFGQNKVLDNINAIFNDNQLYIIKGVSGCGKSTLLKILCGIITDYDGEYLLDGKNVKEINSKQMKKMVGYMCQESLLVSKLTVKDNLLLIKNDISKIEEYAELFKVKKLLNKYPSEISGGERQRIALIRTLLNDPEILLLDEPTSALDHNNSLNFIEALKKIKNKTIILVTHKDLFDEYGNVLKLDYGKLEQTKEEKIANKKLIINSEKDLNIKQLIKYAKIRSKQSILAMIIICFFMLVILAAISLKNNFAREYVNSVKRTYPYMFVEVSDYLQNFPLLENEYSGMVSDIVNSDEFVKYESYTYEGEGYTVYPIYDYDALNFKLDGVLEEGRTPKNQKEVLINYQYADEYFSEDYKDILSKKITINNKEYTVVGVVGPEEIFPWQYGWNYLYKTISGPSVFMMYDELITFGTNSRPDMTMYKYIGDNNIYDHDSIYYKVFINDVRSHYSISENKIANVTSTANFIADIVFIIAAVIGVIGIIFITNQIRLNLFYRKKELGYLQIFGLTKIQLAFTIYFQYLYEIAKCLLISIILFVVCTLIIKLVLGFNFMISIIYILAFIFTILIYSAIVITIPVVNYMHKGIDKLIS